MSSGRRLPPGFPEILSATEGATSVLDVGCGSGRLAVELAACGASVTGIDVSEGRLSEARERAEREGADARFLLCDMTDPLRFADGEFDAAVSRLSLMIAPDPVAVLREVAESVGVLALPPPLDGVRDDLVDLLCFRAALREELAEGGAR